MIDIIQENKLNRGNLPEGWSILSLGELGIWLGGGTPNKSKSLFWTDGTVPWISPKDMKTLFIKETQDLITEAAVENSNARYIEPDAILVVTRSGILKHTLPVAINKVRATFNQDIKALVPHKDISSKFIAYFIRSSEQKILETCSKAGTTVANINFTALKEFVIPLPPLNEQRRIVAKIEELTDRTRKAREALEDVPQLIEQFRRSVLAAAFRGDLTADWREQNPDVEPAIEAKFNEREASLLPSSWSCVNIGSVIESLKYGTSQKCSYDVDGTPVLRIPNVSEGRIDTSDLKYTLFEKKEYQKFQVQVGDILMIRSNGSVSLVGKSALVEEVEEDLAYAGYLIRLRLKRDIVSPDFLNLCLSSPGLRTQIEIPARSTSGVNNINSKEVQKLLIPLPPIKEQFVIVQKLQALDRYLENVQSEYLESLQRVDQLDRAILAKAFRGQLVPQDPTDEPASQLLQRIRSEREKLKPKEKTMKKQKHP
jgi:type I restriction enzyme S subunit